MNPATAPIEQKRIFAVLGVVLIVALVVLGYWFAKSQEQVTRLSSGERMVTAKEGRIVRGFPKELVLEQSIDIEKSYRIEYAPGDQLALQYLSGKTLEENIALFRDYFEKNGWTITRPADRMESPVTFFYATRDTAQVNVTFDAHGEKLSVSIAHIKSQ